MNPPDGMLAVEPAARPTALGFFDRWLTLWVVGCMAAGVALGKAFPGLTMTVRAWELGTGSQVNLAITVLIWLMITPMMMRIDFGSLAGAAARPAGLAVTLIANWLIKPFSMFAFAWVFFQWLFLPVLGSETADQFTAGAIILGAAPCTAMVFVWSRLVDGDAAYTLVQVAVNDVVMLFLFGPIVGLLIGAAGVPVSHEVLLISVAAFIVAPLSAGAALRRWLVRRYGTAWLERSFLPAMQPVTIAALLATLVLIFAFQADSLLSNPLHVALIAVPLALQTYFIWLATYAAMWAGGIRHAVGAPGALVGASNFFELAVATCITLYGPDSGAALAAVVGVLVEVPLMLSLCSLCNRTRRWYDAGPDEAGTGRGPAPAPDTNPHDQPKGPK